MPPTLPSDVRPRPPFRIARCRRLLAAGAAMLLGLSGGAAAQDSPVVRVGPGGYLTAPPKFCKPLPDTPFKTADLTGPMVTGQWWSSLVWLNYSQPLFAHPLVLNTSAAGLTVSQHGVRLTANAAGIFGSSSGKDGDFKIGLANAGDFPSARCAGYSDWFVTAAFEAGNATLKTSFGHGSPFVYCQVAGGDAKLTFPRPPTLWSGSAGDAVLGVTINGNHYGLFGPTGAKWAIDGATLTCQSGGKPYLSVAVLPDNKPETLAMFGAVAHAHVTGTAVDYKVVGGKLQATYQFTLKPMEGDARQTVFALYPHQWKYAKTPLTAMTYNSVRGTMKVGVGPAFTTEIDVQGTLPTLPAEGITDKARMIGYLEAELAKKGTGYADTYWEGKRLGRLASLSGIAELCGRTDLRDHFLEEIRQRLENWFTAAPGKEQPVFYYNKAWGTLVGSKPSYGSDRPLNDHHFHYGYFIRAAAEVARVDPAWAKKWSPMVELLIRDIASTDKADPLFPYLRCFDKYAGHSWASGDANFGDGNNQESSSESMNAWYGMILWGDATGNTAVRDTGVFLFNTERTAVEEYWFDVAGTNYPKDFPNVALGMVWGGKGAFATWFSGDIDCIHGINWLPFTPASVYMGRHPDYVAKNFGRIVEKRKGGTDYNTGWGDLVVMFGALADAAPAAKYIDANPNCKVESGNCHAFMYHWIHTLNTLGRIDAAVTADHPLSNVYVKDGTRTYAVFNQGAKPITVTFSDGKQVVAAPGKLTTAKGR